jgi:hypothetical protein
VGLPQNRHVCTPSTGGKCMATLSCKVPKKCLVRRGVLVAYIQPSFAQEI